MKSKQRVAYIDALRGFTTFLVVHYHIMLLSPFWVLGNEGRGMARFETLLSMYGLGNRMISAKTVSIIDLNSEIEWEQVNIKRKEMQKTSMDFLITALS